MLVPNSWPRVHQEVADLVVELGDEGSEPDPGDVRLGDADHPIDGSGTDARSDAGAAGHRVGRRDERVGAVVQIEEGGLGPLEEHVLVGVERVVHEADRVGDVRAEPG